MTAHFLRHQDLSHSVLLDWILVLAGVLFAWLFWPISVH